MRNRYFEFACLCSTTVLLLVLSTITQAQAPRTSQEQSEWQKKLKQEQEEGERFWRNYFESLSPEEQKHLCNEGIGFDLFPECWQLVDDPQALRRLLDGAYWEPLPTPLLDALERLFSKLPPEDRFQAGALLYRYGRPLGREYLARQLREHLDGRAAIIFAMNRDGEMLPDILKALRTRDSAPIAEALGPWRKPEIAAALLQVFRKMAAKQEPGYAAFITPLGEQGVQEAVPLIRNEYALELSEEGPGKLFNAAALIRLKVKESPQLIP
jgi:hypothetical protein